MKRLIASIIFALAVGLVAAVFLSGCASDKRSEGADKPMPVYAGGMMCPRCETVWVRKRNRYGPSNAIRLSYSRGMTCPDCDAMARSQLLEDGQVMLHGCPTCKITPKPMGSN